MDYQDILEKLPYSEPFLFVDGLTHVDIERAEGYFTFRKDLFFYKGHFKENAVTPGVILTECCAQIGLACLGTYIFMRENPNAPIPKVAMSQLEMDFRLPVFPKEKVRVTSTKKYYRFNKLMCHVKMYNTLEELVCSGTISGMILSDQDGK